VSDPSDRVERAAAAIRTAVALHHPRPGLVRVRGAMAYERVESVCPRDLHVRTGQLLHSLVLEQDGTVAADLYVAPEDDDYLLISDGLDDDRLAVLLGDEVDRLSANFVITTLTGPYACELLTRIAGPQLATFGYLTRFALPELGAGVSCLRTGTTGEYGYDLLIPRELTAAVDARLLELGKEFDLVEVEQRDIDRAALESGFFCPRHRGVLGRSPVELQLQWRLSPDRQDFRGHAGVAVARTEPPARRLCWVIGRLEQDAAPLGPIVRDNVEVGELLDGFVSSTLGCFVGLALIDRRLAHPWIAQFWAGDHELRTEAPPLLQSRSIFVDPRKHVYAHRDEDRFPPIVPGAEPGAEHG
jgi:glycine cleavage system aminomethyltransferase T